MQSHALALKRRDPELEEDTLGELVLKVLKVHQPVLLLAGHEAEVTMLAHWIEQFFF